VKANDKVQRRRVEPSHCHQRYRRPLERLVMRRLECDMIQDFVTKFEAKRAELEATFREKHPDAYVDVVRAVVKSLHSDEYGSIDPERIHQIDDGDYQGTLLFVIAATGYQPSDYWYVKVDYGSCSGCDTLQSISGYSSAPPTDEQVRDYMTLALHVVQGLRKMNDDAAA